MCQPALKYINLALINIHYLIVDEPDGGEMKLVYKILDTELLKLSYHLKVEWECGLHPLPRGELCHQEKTRGLKQSPCENSKPSALQMQNVFKLKMN